MRLFQLLIVLLFVLFVFIDGKYEVNPKAYPFSFFLIHKNLTINVFPLLYYLPHHLAELCIRS